MNEKQKLIEACITLLDCQNDDDTKNRARSYYENCDVDALQEEADKLSHKTDAYEAREAALRAQAKLQIFQHSSLVDNARNEQELDRLLPGPLLSFETFRSMLQQNPDIAKRFTFSGVPFGRVLQAEQQHRAAETHKFNMFQQACIHLAVSGQADIAPSEANYGLISAQISEPVTTQSMIAALTNGAVQGLSGNAPGVVDAWREESLVQERQDLCRIIADNYTRDPFGREAHYKQLFAARYKPIESLRAEAEEIKLRKALRNLDPEQLKEIIRSGQAPAAERKLPPIISAYEIRIADRRQLATWIEHYGADALNRRLLGQDEV